MNYKISFGCLFFLSCFFSYGQLLNTTANDSLVTNPEHIASQHLKENIYIHTDKDIYEPGENLWFKAYILKGTNLALSTDTKIIFVELIQLHDDKNQTITREKYEAINGFANGHLFLEQTLEDGAYQLIIHTKNTLESASKEIIAVKEIQVKENIIPKVLVDAEFTKRVYNRDEAVEAELTVFSRSRIPYTNTTIVAHLYGGTKKLDRIRLKTDDQGIAFIRFAAEKSKKATHIKLRIKTKGYELKHTIEIPYTNISEIQFGMYPEGGNLVEELPNTVAFKALDPSGRPVQVTGDLYENGKKIRSFSAIHNGMGKFGFIPKNNQKYTVKLTQPRLDSVFELPNILPEGIKLQVNRSNKKHVHFNIIRSSSIPSQKVYIRAQHRGLIYWMATASLEKEAANFKLPLEKLPQGIVEVTLFNENFQPLAERLIYTNIDQKLHVTLKEISKSFFKQKEKVTLKFAVKDQYKNPAVANFSMSVHDHLYANKNNDYAIMPHYYLFSELKGHVYDASYYFNPIHKDRAKHLDLLLLTQGWRTYVWNKKNLSDVTSTTVFTPFVNGKVYRKLENGALQNISEASVNVSYPSYTHNIETNKKAAFSLPLVAYKAAQGTEIVLIPFEDKNAVIKVNAPFEHIEEATEKHISIFPKNDLALHIKKQSSYDPKFSFTETNFLEEVNLSSFSGRNKNHGSKGMYGNVYGDYVCQFNILNCKNHPYGNPPEDGRTYRLNDGSFITYIARITGKKREANERFVKIKGLYPEKEFYSPQYDKNPDEAMFPDNRKTLFWAPNLVTNKNGEIEVSFFTSDVQTTFFGKLEGTNGNGLLGGTIFQFDVN